MKSIFNAITDSKSVKLRPLPSSEGTPPDHTRGKTVVLNAVDQEKALNKRLRDCDIEAWYEPLQNFTYPANFVSISQDEGRAIMEYYWTLKMDTDTSQSVENEAILSNLASRLHNEAMRFSTSDTFPNLFVKLSCRSPKDSKGRQEKAHALAAAYLHQTLSEDGKFVNELRDDATGDGKLSRVLPDGNALCKAIYHATINCLKMESAEEVVNCLCTSERVCEDDLPLALTFPSAWSQHIILRPWMSIATHHEFRAFVFNGQLTGLCQYFSSAYFTEIVSNKVLIEHTVKEFFAEIKDLVPIEPAAYVMDIAVNVSDSDKSPTQQVKIIEFNPFGAPDGMGTGTIMFNLDQTDDRDILFGDKPFEFRVRESPLPGVTDLIKGEWRSFLQSEGFLDT